MENLVFNEGYNEERNWIITEKIFDNRYLGKCEALFTQGNGYLGVRNSLDEKYVGERRNTFVTGTFNKASEEEVTELPNFPDVTNIEITINGKRLNLNYGQVKEYNRSINLKNGEVSRSFIWSSENGLETKFIFKRFVSLENEHLIASSVDIESNKDIDLVITTGIDGAVTNSGAQHFINIERRIHENYFMQYLTETSQSRVLGVIHSTYLCNYEDIDILPIMGRRTLLNKISASVKQGSKFHFEKISDIRSNRDKEFIDYNNDNIRDILKEKGLTSIKEAYKKGYDVLLNESSEKWNEFWKNSDIEIESEVEFDQLATRFALYHLNIMVKHDDNRVGIGAKALSGEGYKGHSFWDTEIFILPYFILSNPNTARTLLEYRYKCLYGARKKAKEYGYEGAMYPWECAWIDDGEVTPLSGGADVITGEELPILTGILEHHITADIAYAVWQYYQATNDLDFMKKYGYEVIIDTAKFWASRVEFNSEKDRYEITNVIGPDEYKEHVDNNAYTNYMAVNNMRLALNIIEKLAADDKDTYKKLDNKLNLDNVKSNINKCVEKVYLPLPNKDEIIPQNDTYLSLKELDLNKYKNSTEVLTIYNDFNMEKLNEYMVSKQSDLVMLLFVLEDLFDINTKKKNFVFYEDKTLHDSSLSKATHMILANDYGFYDLADNLFDGALTIDLGKNMNSSNEGIHSASIGGIWQSVVMGYGGLRLAHGELRISPRLPKKWNKLSYSTIWQGNEIKVMVTKNKLEVTNKGTEKIKINIFDELVEIESNLTITREFKG